MNPDKKAVLIFELGHLQVFCYQSLEEWSRGITPAEVFWQKKGEPQVHGPFLNVYTAVGDYSTFISPKIPVPDNVIQVDFKAKKRIK